MEAKESLAALADASKPKDSSFRRLYLGARDRFAASDPAFSRLRMASRAVLSMLLAAVALAVPTLVLHPLPIASYGIAVPLCFMGTLAVRDTAPRAQIVTRALAAVTAVASAALASALSPRPWLTDAVYLVVIFAAVYVRKFGPRGFVLGMVAFMSFFMGDYLHPALTDLGWVAYSAIMALAGTHVARNVLLPSDSESDFRRALVSVDQHIGLILSEAQQLSLEPEADRKNKTLRTHMGRLRSTILMAEGFLPQGAEGSLAAEGAASDVATALFDMQLLVERIVRAQHRNHLPDGLMRAVLARDATIVENAAARLRALDPERDIPSRMLIRLYRARLRLDEALGHRPSAAFAPGGGDAPPASGAGPAAGAGRPPIPQMPQAPIQVTLACAVAMAASLLISPQRWYWAVIAAFIVFNNTRSRGDTAVKALQRSAGTLGGILAGSALAALLHGQTGLNIAVIIVSIFFAFYYLQVSYALLIFFVTIALALGYGMMGMFAPDILLVRLEETVIGALAGTAMAFLVFPRRTTADAAEALDAYLSALGRLVENAARKAHGDPGAGDVIGLSRDLDRRYADLLVAARPLGGSWNAVTRFGLVRERLLLLTGCTHWGRMLARALSEMEMLDPRQLQRIDALSSRIADQIARASERKTSFFMNENRRSGAASDELPRTPTVSPLDNHPVVALEQISVLLDRLTAETEKSG